MTDIPLSVVATAGDNGEIPLSVAELSQQDEAPEITPYIISFSQYNEGLCEIKALAGNKGKKAIEILKTIGTKVRSTADFAKHNIDRIPVVRTGEYLKLFSGLEEDIELKEAKLQSTGRIFYFDLEPKRMFFVVAIRENHFETDKVRR